MPSAPQAAAPQPPTVPQPLAVPQLLAASQSAATAKSAAAPTTWRSVIRPGFLRTAHPWRAAAYLLATGLSGLLLCILLLLGTVVSAALTALLIGLPLLAALTLAGLPYAALERRLLGLLGQAVPPSPHHDPSAPGPQAWLRTRYREPATWRELGLTALAAVLLWPIDLTVLACAVGVPLWLLGSPLLLALDGEQVNVLKVWQIHDQPTALALAALGLLALAALAHPLTVLAAARAALVRQLAAPGEQEREQERRIGELVRSRARLVDAFEAERRRIERDLHDGAQQRLVALTMSLGLARIDAPVGSPLAARLAEAHREVGHVLTEIRELISGIHPQVLTDRGLPEAVADLADRTPVPVGVDVDLPGRPSSAVEAACYFAVAEALANLARHSGARRASLTGRYADGRLTVEVSDDGHGGADPSRGTGLTGLADRLAVVDGTLTLSSPPGGPTLLRLEIPCTLTPAQPR